MVDQNKNLVSMAKQFSGLPMKELIGAPLVAAAKANNMMAVTQTKFLLETCFALKKQGEKEIYKPIMINMTLTRPVINSDGSQAESVETDFNLPLLTIIPLNSLVVDEVSIKFEMEVKSSFASDKSAGSKKDSEDKNSITRKISDSNESAELLGSVAASAAEDTNDSSSFKKSNSAKYEINAHAGQIPLPVGVLTIIDAFSKSMAPIQLKTSDQPEKVSES